MICPILEAIEIIDDAEYIFDDLTGRESPSSSPRHSRLHDLGLRIDALRNETDCPPDLVDSIGDLVMGMVNNRRLPVWKAKEMLGAALHDPEAMAELQGYMMGGRVK